VDVYAVFFIILMYYYMHQYFNMNFFKNNFKSTLLPLLLSGVFFGLGAATKWYTLYGGLGLAIIFFTSLVQRFYEYKKAKERTTLKKHKIDASKRKEDKVIVQLFYRYAALTLLWCLLAFVLIPVIIYVLSYMPLKMIPGQSYGLSDIFASQKHMYRYHSQLQATHPFSSAWWQWPIIRKPVWAYTGQQELPADGISSIVIMGNPAVWWIGSLAIIMAVVTALCRKEKAMFVVLVAVASQYLPWIIGARKLLFIYHFFATVPFMVLCITYMLKVLREKFSKFKYITYVYLAVILVLFIMFYPILSGMVISKSFASTYLRWFKSWIFFQ
ncbi:MAG: dolichyl-phosphate-mannose--protein mannosyltransferase, partial [Planctomycetota bacterium]